MRTVRVAFFSDGFTVDDAEEDEAEDVEDARDAEELAPRAAPPRRGIQGLSDLASAPAKGLGKGMQIPKLPKLPPLRAYDAPENEAFLADLKANRLPSELKKLDENGLPIGVSIAVADLRPKSYAELVKMQEELEEFRKRAEAAQSGGAAVAAAPKGPALFTGSGNTLAGPSSGEVAASGVSAGSGSGAVPTADDAALVALVSGAPAPAVDESKPATTLQLRMASGARVKLRLNLDHTISDLWRHVAAQMGAEAFATAAGHELAAGFPLKPLRDTTVTLAAADLANASVTHRCK